jgi:translation initiation factor 1
MALPGDPINDLQKLKELFPDMPEYIPDPQEAASEEIHPSLSLQQKAQMKLYVSRDKKHRGGKQVTLIEGHEGPDDEMEKLLAQLKSLCSAGGSLKDHQLLIQGDHVKKVIAFLVSQGYKNTKQKGG